MEGRDGLQWNLDPCNGGIERGRNLGAWVAGIRGNVEVEGWKGPFDQNSPFWPWTPWREMLKYPHIMSYFLFEAVNFICDHPDIKAISFVGSNQAGEYIYERGSRNGKRVQSNMVMPPSVAEVSAYRLLLPCIRT